VLSGTTPLHDATVAIPLGGDVVLHVLPRGSQPVNPTGLLKSHGLRTLVATLASQYDLVIFDSPPVNLVSDALLIGKLVEGVVVVARAGITDINALAQAVRHLRDANAPLLGVLLNDINLNRDSSYDESYRYLHQAGAYVSASEP
jgi:Mrp family chromosome partitioning ATPase